MITYNYFLFCYYTHKYKSTTKELFIPPDLAKLVLHVNQSETIANKNCVMS